MANVDDTVQNTFQLLLGCVNNEKKLPNKVPPSIYMVPSVFRDRSPSCFNPRVVSIGPLHREERKLQEFETYKASTVHELLQRFKEYYPPEQMLQKCVQKVIGSIGKIRECYGGMKTYSDVELAEMMVIDACFILEFINNYSKRRPVVTNMLLQFHLIYDLLLLENQIPFFVLDHIFHEFWTFNSEVPLSKFILPCLKNLHLLDEDPDIEKIAISKEPPHHILDLLHQCYRPRDDNKNDLSGFSSSCNHSAVDLDRAGVSSKPNKNAKSGFPSSFNHSAVDLDRAGVSFKPNNKDAKWSLAMEVEFRRIPYLSLFWTKPTLRMPVLLIHDYTKLILKNLMAYEQSSLDCALVTSYFAAMDMLVNTEEDVARLVKSKVLKNIIGSNDEAADMMNHLCKEIDWTPSSYSEQWRKLDDYYNEYWPKHVAWLRRTYFSSPWNIIALVAGIVLFGLTVVQTIFSIIKK